MRAVVFAMLSLLAVGFDIRGAVAQEGPGGAINPQRDCQTVVTCNFRRNGAPRGCLSSYTCRQCKLVSAPCRVGDRRKVCLEFSCGWGA